MRSAILRDLVSPSGYPSSVGASHPRRRLSSSVGTTYLRRTESGRPNLTVGATVKRTRDKEKKRHYIHRPADIDLLYDRGVDHRLLWDPTHRNPHGVQNGCYRRFWQTILCRSVRSIRRGPYVRESLWRHCCRRTAGRFEPRGIRSVLDRGVRSNIYLTSYRQISTAKGKWR